MNTMDTYLEENYYFAKECMDDLVPQSYEDYQSLEFSSDDESDIFDDLEDSFG